VHNKDGEIAVKPGQVARATAGTPPSVTTSKTPTDPGLVRRLRAENEDLKAAIDNARAAAGGDAQKILADNQALRDKLRADEAELQTAAHDRSDKEGVAMSFPKDLPPRFAQQQLLQAFTGALKEAGINGDVTHIDCDEYPCIVYGDTKMGSDVDATQISNKLKNASAFAPYQDDEDNSSWWRSLQNDKNGGPPVDETHFGIALWPKGDAANDDSDAIGKRIGFRNQQMWDAMKPAKAH
jgi:hypothetical protein